MNMPTIDLSMTQLTGEEMQIAQLILNGNRLRASRPDYKRGGMHSYAAYVWRHVAFALSPKRQHQCMPCLDFCYLPKTDRFVTEAFDYTWSQDKILAHAELKREREQWLHGIVDAIVKTKPITEQPGTMAWAKAFGKI